MKNLGNQMLHHRISSFGITLKLRSNETFRNFETPQESIDLRKIKPTVHRKESSKQSWDQIKGMLFETKPIQFLVYQVLISFHITEIVCKLLELL